MFFIRCFRQTEAQQMQSTGLNPERQSRLVRVTLFVARRSKPSTAPSEAARRQLAGRGHEPTFRRAEFLLCDSPLGEALQILRNGMKVIVD
jgi:hypothetical protein